MPVTGHRIGDLDVTPNRIENLLTEARDIILLTDMIIAWSASSFYVTQERFTQVRINWVKLAEELEASG